MSFLTPNTHIGAQVLDSRLLINVLSTIMFYCRRTLTLSQDKLVVNNHLLECQLGTDSAFVSVQWLQIVFFCASKVVLAYA